MLVSFPSPVLSVAVDVVRDLDGCDTLPTLWTLFTKCKESLKDGRRLENISWRLWYREMMVASPERFGCPPLKKSEKDVIENGNLLDCAYRPPTPDEAAKQVSTYGSAHLAPSQGSFPPDRLTPSLRRRPSLNSISTRPVSSVPARKSRRLSIGVGRIIYDMLLPPETLRLEPSSRRTAPDHAVVTTTSSSTIAATSPDPCPIKCDLAVIQDGLKATSSLPTPSAEENEPPQFVPSGDTLPQKQSSHDPLESAPAQVQDPSPSEVPALTVLGASDPPAPAISIPNLIHAPPSSSSLQPDSSSTPLVAASHGLTLPPPRLIVVNPTPNLTPHPTPPATPVLHSTSPQLTGGFFTAAKVHSGNQHLLPPPPAYHAGAALQPSGLGPTTGPGSGQNSAIVQGVNLTGSVTPAREEHRASAKTEPPRTTQDALPPVPPSPALTDDAMDQLHRDQLRHPLTVYTKVDAVTTKASVNLMLVPSSPSVVAHIFREPCATRSVRSSPTKSPISSPTMDPLTSPTAESEKAVSPRPVAHLRRQSTGGAKVSSGPRKVSRTQSTCNVVTLSTIITTSATSSATHSRSGSRSRSRDGPGLGLGAGGLAMTRAASTGAPAKAKGKLVVGGSKAVAARLGARKERERSKLKEKEKDNDRDSLKRPTFKIGSNSDEGSGVGSKSVGSGSEVSGAPVAATESVRGGELNKDATTEKGKESEDAKALMEEKTIIGAQAVLEALLPQQQQQQQQQTRRIVLATSDSDDDYETDDGSWSSEEVSGEDVEGPKSGVSEVAKEKQELHQSPQQLQPPQPPPPLSPPPPPQQQQQQQQQQRAVAHHAQVDGAGRYKHLPTNPQLPPAYHNDKRNHAIRGTRRQHLLNQAKANTQSLQQAALEAQRQREMFAKIPPSDNIARTQSFGLLSQLMNPDPQIFPPNHPYRRGCSSGEIGARHPGQGQIRLPGGLTVTGMARHVAQPEPTRAQLPSAQPQGQHKMQNEPPPSPPPPVAAPRLPEVNRQAPAPPPPPQSQPPQPPRQPQQPQQQQHQYVAPSLKPSKSSAAMPVASQVQVGSLRPNSGGGGETSVDRAAAFNGRLQDDGRPPGGYRPRARPQDAELEEESGTEEDNHIQVSKSVAQEKLRALAERRGIRPNRRASTDDANADPLPAWAQQPQQQQQQPQPGRHPQHPPPPVRTHSTPAPIPQALSHPYNLPLTALPTTPRTTRRHMLQTEMSESLRRNLLWERQVSKNNILGFRRTASSGGGGGGARGNILSGLRPLATNDPVPAPPNVVQLSARGAKNHKADNNNNNNNANPNPPGNPAAAAAAQAAGEPSTRSFTRNRSWAADDYHYAGW